MRLLEVGVYSQRVIMGKGQSKVNPTPLPQPKKMYVAPETLAKFPKLKTAVEAAMNEPSPYEKMDQGVQRREAFETTQSVEFAAAEILGEVWKTANDEDKNILLANVPDKIVRIAQGFYGVPGVHGTAALHGGRRKTKKSKRRSRKTRRSRK
jgi:hypothetical protein